MKQVRTRYAPSPTGRMHVGNLRTALYEFLIAKHAGAHFYLEYKIQIGKDLYREPLISFTRQ